MADSKISALNPVSPTIDDIVPIVDLSDTTTKKTTFSLIKDLLASFFQATLVSGTNIKSINGNSLLGSGNLVIVPTDNLRGGIIDYNDLATATTPISIPGTSTFTALTNDAAGPYTSRTYAPVGVTDVWDSGVDQRFEWTQLKLGDSLNIRLDLTIVVSTVNTEVGCDLFIAEGSGADYQLPFIQPTNFKNTGTYRVVVSNPIYMGDNNTLTFPAHFKFKADKACTVKVNGWACDITVRG